MKQREKSIRALTSFLHYLPRLSAHLPDHQIFLPPGGASGNTKTVFLNLTVFTLRNSHQPKYYKMTLFSLTGMVYSLMYV